MSYKQDLFWKNLPIDRKRTADKLGFLQSLNFKRMLLANNKNVCFIWTGTNRISKLEIEYNSKMQNKLKKKIIEIYLYEPICLSINGEYNCSFYSEFDSKLKYENVVSEELESVRIFKKKNNLVNVKVYTSDYNLKYLKTLYPDLDLYCLDSFIRHRAVNEGGSLPNKIVKRFWCGNWRYTAHRHLIMSYLVHIEGNYSWNLQCSFDDLQKNVWFDLDKLQKTHIEKFVKIKHGAALLYNDVFRIDTNIDQIKIENFSDVYIPGLSSPPQSDKFYDSYKECFCAVVNETRFAQPFGYFSEKTTTAILSRLPVIVVGPPRTLEYLKTFGFKTFDKWWDESYDIEEDHEKRLIKIFDVIDCINSKSLQELATIYDEMAEILEHNISVVKSIPYNTTAL